MKVAGTINYFSGRMILLPVLLAATAMEMHSQQPTHYPSDRGPVDLDLAGILLYIVFPLVLVLAFILIRRTRKKKEREE